MKKLFVIVDAFLDKSQKTVQACHGIARWCEDYYGTRLDEWNPKEGHIVLKKCQDLESWLPEVDVSFREPYWGNRLTVLVAYREEGFAEELPLA
jgi:hypothetical protein